MPMFSDKCLNQIQSHHSVKFNRNTLSVLKLFHKDIHNVYHNLISNKFEIPYVREKLDPEGQEKMKRKLSVSKFLPRSIVTDVIKSSKYKYSYSLILDNKHIQIHFIDKSGYKKKMEKYVYFCCLWFMVISKYTSRACPNQLDVYIYLSGNKKILPKDRIPMTSEHINSAFTYGGCHLHNEIVVFRKEEWFKVLIHESIHAFGLDFSNIHLKKQIDEDLKSIFPLNIEMNAFEAYTEVWANIWHSMLYAYLDTKSTFMGFIRSFKDVYLYECYFSYYQMNKILEYHNMTYYDLFMDSEDSIQKRKTYMESTNIFSYYILKTILLQHINEFFAFCCQDFNIIQFNMTSMRGKQFVDLIRQCYGAFPYPMKDTITASEIKNTLRFTLFDIK